MLATWLAPASATMKASVSPATSGRSGSRVILSPLSAATTCSSSARSTAAAACPERPRGHRLPARCRSGRQRSELLDLNLRRRQGMGALVVGGLVEVADRREVRVEPGERRRSAGGRLRPRGALATVRTGTPGASGRPRSAPRRSTAGRSGTRPTRAAGSRRPRAARRRPDRRARRRPRRTNAGCSSGTSVEDTYAISARSPIAARPAARPWSGPRPSRSSVTTSTAPSSAGNACPGADTTTTGPSTDRATIPVTRRSRVEPCQSSAAFGEPIREDRPPASTIAGRLAPLARW